MHTFAVARAVHGIEPLVATEIRRSRLGVVRGVRHREVWFEAAPGADLTGLRTADDVLLAAAVVDGIGHGRSALRRLALAARSVDLGGLTGSGVEVSASFVGRRNYTRFEIEDAVGAELARPLRLPYHSRRDGARPPREAMSWRVTIEGDRALIALRLADRPLHRRAYKTDSIRGTLHPPVAAAMAALGRLGGAGTVLDPCCGAGTTLIEARALAPGARLLGFDHDPAALRAATANARADTRQAGVGGGAAFGWGVADGGRIPVAGGSVDRVLVNPPWGRQVPPRGLLARDLGPLWREVRRVLAGDGLAVALVHDGIPRGFALEEAVRVSLSGRHPVIAVLRKEGGPVRR
ncbi:methyltransferase domain-containing protein [Nonomuraea angiospora]|uniref:23S rRNA G2445 N2-methylase RlmL n=1 Tax=Nonomuraea angiospora TaxID=46172 RepID=A0ABR9LZR8_9ACTN|nr:methyltransferase domain-containing protein [Nonomuraea angiospora]MBE1586149.1 23S rRNA G2445 N2-methylase RlmL [Nonomuraea angiospora]